ncbi:MAG: hypothetical protein CSH37_13705 [Thalassolituus sp.]|nr:MAG: hypothetical protein CSH37_13705 [Thalassolituus sp.]
MSVIDYCLVLFHAEFNSRAERDRAALYLAKDTRPEWGDDCLDECSDEEDAIFEAVDDCVFPLTLKTVGNTGLRWVCDGGEDDDIPTDWPERLKAMTGTTVICISAGGEINWQVMQFDRTAPEAATKTAYVTRFYDDRERDHPIEDFERQFTTPEWEAAMFDGDEEYLLEKADEQVERWLAVLKSIEA